MRGTQEQDVLFPNNGDTTGTWPPSEAQQRDDITAGTVERRWGGVCVCVCVLRNCANLPHAGLFPIHDDHVVDFVLLDASLLRLIQLLGNEAHEGVVWCVSCVGVCVFVYGHRRVRTWE